MQGVTPSVHRYDRGPLGSDGNGGNGESFALGVPGGLF